MFFTGKAKYYNDTTDKVETFGFFVDADDYAGAVEKLVQHYGRSELEGFSIDTFSPNRVLEFSDIDLYYDVRKNLETAVIW